MNQRATVRIHGNCGVGVAENMMSGGGDRRRQRQPVGRRHGARRAAGDPRRRVGPLRDLAEGRRHRRPRLGRPHERVHGPDGAAWSCAATPARRSATRSTRRGSTCAARWPGSAPTASRRRCADEHRRELAELLLGEPGSTPTRRTFAATARRAQLYNFKVDNLGSY